jgi:hypothetical protein
MQGGRELHLKFCSESLKQNILDNYFETIKKKLSARGQNAVVIYGSGTFASCGPRKHVGVPTECMKRACKGHFLTRASNVEILHPQGAARR